MTTERPTPLTDANLVEAGTCMTQKELRAGFVKADFARQLERMCAELAHELQQLNPYCGCDCCLKGKNDALARYNNLMKG